MSVEGEMKFFLGLQIGKRMMEFLQNRSKFTKNLVLKFEITQSKPLDTPIRTSEKVNKDAEGKDVDTKMYKSMIGSLIYLTISRPGISFNVGVCIRHQAAIKVSYLKATKRIIGYICGIINYRLWYPFDTNRVIASYSNADWTGNVADWKNTSGRCFYVKNCLVSWHMKKQNSIYLSTADAEYITVRSG